MEVAENISLKQATATPSKAIEVAADEAGQSNLLGNVFVFAGLGAGLAIVLWFGLQRLSFQHAQRSDDRDYQEAMLGLESFSSLQIQGESKPSQSLDTHQFMVESKSMFMRVQQARDQRDLHAAQNLMTGEMFAAFHQQIENAPQRTHTGIEALHAVLVDSLIVDEEQQVRVEFSGLVHEGFSGNTSPFREVWQFTRKLGSPWFLAQTQQFDVQA